MSVVNLLGNMTTHNYTSVYLVHTEMMDEAIRRGGVFTGAVGILKSEPLLVDDMFVFSGLCQRQQGYLWEFEVGKIYRTGEIEPCDLMKQKIRNFSYPMRSTYRDVSGVVSQSSDESLSSKVNQDNSRLIIVCPSCHNFQVSSAGSFPPVVSFLVMFISSLPLIAIGVLSHFETGSSTLAERIWIMGSLIFGMVSITNAMFADWVIRTTVDNPLWTQLRRPNLADPQAKKRYYYDGGVFLHLILTLCVISIPAIGRFVVVGQMLLEYGSCSQLQKLGV
jgi:hypothetical protein